MSKSCTSYLRQKLAEIVVTDKLFLRSINRMLLDAIHKYGEDEVEKACEVLHLQDYLKHLDLIGAL
jgi:hypothetical protein